MTLLGAGLSTARDRHFAYGVPLFLQIALSPRQKDVANRTRIPLWMARAGLATQLSFGCPAVIPTTSRGPTTTLEHSAFAKERPSR